MALDNSYEIDFNSGEDKFEEVKLEVPPSKSIKALTSKTTEVGDPELEESEIRSKSMPIAEMDASVREDLDGLGRDVPADSHFVDL